MHLEWCLEYEHVTMHSTNVRSSHALPPQSHLSPHSSSLFRHIGFSLGPCSHHVPSLLRTLACAIPTGLLSLPLQLFIACLCSLQIDLLQKPPQDPEGCPSLPPTLDQQRMGTAPAPRPLLPEGEV